MASLRKSIVIAKPASEVWDAVRDSGQLHTRIAPGLVVNTQLTDGGETRIVTFANDMVLTEHIISNDDETQRLAWTALSDQWTHHNASLQVFALADGSSETVWTADVLPHAAGDMIAQIIDMGLGAMKAHLEGQSHEHD